MRTSQPQPIIVAGGTGNVGAFVVKELLAHEAIVVVPSRSDQQLHELRAYLTALGMTHRLHQLHTVVGNLSDEAAAAALHQQIMDQVGVPQAVVASFGHWHGVPSLLSAHTADLERVVGDYLLPHFVAARTFLPSLSVSGGTYVLVNGPLAFDVWPGSGAALISTVTAAQHMLFRALAQELEGSPVRIIELVNYAFLRNKQTQPSSALPGEAVGAFVAYVLHDAARTPHGQSIHLRSPEQLIEAERSWER